MAHTEHVFRACFGPTHRDTQLATGPTDKNFFGINAGLCAEPSANIGSNHTNIRLVDAKNFGESVAGAMCTLTAGPLCQARSIPGSYACAYFHRRRSNLLVLDGQINDHVAIRENVVVTGGGKREDNVGFSVWVKKSLVAK